MGFPDSFKIVVSKAQALKQSGNSIVVDVLIAILKILSALEEKWKELSMIIINIRQ